MRLDDSLRDRQAESDSAQIAFACLEEAIENTELIGGGDTTTGIGDTEHDLRAATRRANCDQSMAWRELQRVADQIADRLQDAIAVGAHQTLADRNHALQRDLPIQRGLTERLLDLMEDRASIYTSSIEA